MSKTYKNYHAGSRGINLDNGGTHWVEPGQEVTVTAKDKDGEQFIEVGDEKLKIRGDLPDFGKASDQAEKDADEVVALRARVEELETANADLTKQVETLTKPADKK